MTKDINYGNVVFSNIYGKFRLTDKYFIDTNAEYGYYRNMAQEWQDLMNFDDFLDKQIAIILIGGLLVFDLVCQVVNQKAKDIHLKLFVIRKLDYFNVLLYMMFHNIEAQKKDVIRL